MVIIIKTGGFVSPLFLSQVTPIQYGQFTNIYGDARAFFPIYQPTIDAALELIFYERQQP
jgi:hypothetical protein